MATLPILPELFLPIGTVVRMVGTKRPEMLVVDLPQWIHQYRATVTPVAWRDNRGQCHEALRRTDHLEVVRMPKYG